MEYINLQNKLEEIGVYVRDTYKSKLKAGNVYATGKLYNSVRYRVEVTETGIGLYFGANDYWINIEKGKDPNTGMPTVEVIRKWMISKGIPVKPGAAYFIARSIDLNGIKPKPYLREIKINLKEYNQQIKDAITKDIESFVENNIKNKIKK